MIQRYLPSLDNVQHGFEISSGSSAALLSISVRPVRFNPVPCRRPTGDFKTLRPQARIFTDLQGRGMRRTGRTPIDDNEANQQKQKVEACVTLSTEGR